jgi:hypothetical protein
VDQALPEELFTDLSVRGFEALFEPATNNGVLNSSTYPTGTGSNTPLGTASANNLDTGTGATPYTPAPADSTWTLRAASEKLGLSPNTIRKRIRTGQLRADKIIGFNGPEWRIHPPQMQQMPPTQTTAQYMYPSVEPSLGSTDLTLETLLKIVETQAKQLEIATTQLAASTEHVKAATRVIAYQQLQLEEKNNKVKLLTDSRHHDNWIVKLARRFKKS